MTVAAWLAGVLDLAFAGFHVLFWRLFQWPERLGASGDTNAAITQTLNIVLIYVFVVTGLTLVGYAWRGAPVPPELGWSTAMFWVLRTLLQPLMFSMRYGASRLITIVFVVTAAAHAATALI